MRASRNQKQTEELMKVLRRFLPLLIVLAVLAGLVYGFWPKPVAVETARVVRGPLEVMVEDDGRTRVRERYVVSAPLTGRLLRVHLEAGDEVLADDTELAVIVPTDPALLDPRARAEAQARVDAAAARVKQTRHERDKAQAEFDYAESELARQKKLFADNVATESDVEKAAMLFRARSEQLRAAEYAVKIAAFELDQARAALKRFEPTLESRAEPWNLSIKSPVSGRVFRVMQESERVVSPGDHILELGDPTLLEVEVDVLSQQAVNVRPGQKAYLHQWGGEKPLEGIVRVVEPSGFTKVSALGVEEQRVNVIIDLTEPRETYHGLGDGYRVDARIVVWEGEQVLKVPTGALFRNEGGWAVFVVESGRAELRRIRLGRRNGLEAQVLDGLDEHEQVIVYPGDRISDGARVTATEQNP